MIEFLATVGVISLVLVIGIALIKIAGWIDEVNDILSKSKKFSNRIEKLESTILPLDSDLKNIFLRLYTLEELQKLRNKK